MRLEKIILIIEGLQMCSIDVPTRGWFAAVFRFLESHWLTFLMAKMVLLLLVLS